MCRSRGPGSGQGLTAPITQISSGRDAISPAIGGSRCQDDGVTSTDSDLWIVDVVLRAHGRENDEGAVIAAVADALSTHAEGPPQQTSSYDIPPPDGSIGVSCLLRTAGAGDAVDQAINLVSAAATAVTGISHALWDVRALPEAAVLQREHAMQADDERRHWRKLRRR